MKWISIQNDSPDTEVLGGREILVLVNGRIYLCTVIPSPKYGLYNAYITDNLFLYCSEKGWCGDPRFASPTHWMALPDIPD